MKGKIYSIILFVLFLIPAFLQAQWTVQPQKIVKPVGINDSDTVYVMAGDTVFHRADCKLLTGGRSGMPYETAKARGLKPCPECLFEKPTFYPGYDWAFSLVQPKPNKALLYSDNIVEVMFIITDTQIALTIQNKLESTIKIIWDEVSFVSPAGSASRVVHSGVKIIDRNSSQPPTIIPPKANITDNIIPSDHIRYVNNSWEEGKLFDGNPMFYNGKEFGLYFPVEMKGAKKEYSYRFKINVAQITLEGK